MNEPTSPGETYTVPPIPDALATSSELGRLVDAGRYRIVGVIHAVYADWTREPAKEVGQT